MYGTFKVRCCFGRVLVIFKVKENSSINEKVALEVAIARKVTEKVKRTIVKIAIEVKE